MWSAHENSDGQEDGVTHVLIMNVAARVWYDIGTFVRPDANLDGMVGSLSYERRAQEPEREFVSVPDKPDHR